MLETIRTEKFISVSVTGAIRNRENTKVTESELWKH